MLTALRECLNKNSKSFHRHSAECLVEPQGYAETLLKGADMIVL